MSEDPTQDRAVEKRLKALEEYHILDTPAEAAFNDIVLLATRICETPVALVSLVTDERQWFKAKAGIEASETPISNAVCAHAIRQKGVLIIPDLTQDERTKNNPLVTHDPFIRFYAGAVLETPNGIPLGTLCVIDTKPRPGGLNAIQIDSLQALARQVMSQMELRRALQAKIDLDLAAKQQQDLLKEELHHRLKNILTMVQAIISQTFRTAANFDDARTVLFNRIIALGKAQEILFAGVLQQASLETIVKNTVKLYSEDFEKHFHVSGPETLVGPKVALSLALMMHELTTNATKYGALSAPDGKITIDWQIIPGADPHLAFAWRESGGPPVSAPTRRGFGTQLIERAFAAEVGATIKLDYAPTGFECHLSAPMSRITDID